MNFSDSFRKIGDIDTAEILKLASELSDEQWQAEEFRQRRYEVHRDTQTIGLVFDQDFRHSHPTRLPMLQIFEVALRPVLQLVAEFYEESEKGVQLTEQYGFGYFIRATLVRLKAGGSIDEHTDNNFSLAHSHRVHIPIDTNEKVLFSVGKENRNLKVGEVVEINNRRPHSVKNQGDTDRIHLILDFVLPGEQCCCGVLHHPQTLCSPLACRATDHLEIPCECYPET